MVNDQNQEILSIGEMMENVRLEMGKVIIGQNDLIELLMLSIFTDGHLLIEGVPGVAKTLSAKLMAKIIDVHFSRIQFTPDLMPGDVLGTTVFNPGEVSFEFKKGPVFSNIILIDEINRAPAKTQSALFEVMEERQVTIDGHTHLMDVPFVVLATQNPIEQEGTYRLPEAQLDRFLFKLNIGYPGLDEEIAILENQQDSTASALLEKVKPLFGSHEVRKFREIVNTVKVEPPLIRFIAQIVNETRNHPSIYLGASPRASLALLRSSKAFAAMNGRDFVIPEDILHLTPYVICNRIMLTPEKEMEGLTPEDIIASILQKIEIPR